MELLIRRDLAFLFEEHGATVISNSEDWGSFGGSEIRVAAGNVEFLFCKHPRDAGDEIRIGPSSGRGIWETPRTALAASTMEDPRGIRFRLNYEWEEPSLSYIGLRQFEGVLRPRFERLDKAFSPENYASTRERCAQLERQLLH